MRLKNKYVIILIIIFFSIVGALMFETIIPRHSYLLPQETDFEMELKYDEKEKIVAKLRNKSKNDYLIMVAGTEKQFIDLHVINGENELPINKEPVISKILLKKNSTIKQQLLLNESDIPNDYHQMYAKVSFFIIDKKALKKENFEIKSNLIEIKRTQK